MYTKVYLWFLLCLLPFWGVAQTISVSGRVVDGDTQTPLIGATVLAKGTSTGALTNDQGDFSLAVDQGATLVITYYGYSQVEVAVNQSSNVGIISMKPDFQNLDEVVVVGYTTQRKKDITAAVSIVDLEAIENTPYGNVLQALAGQASGISLTQDGQPGSGRTTLKIRGTTTLNNSNPLYVIDGLPSEEGLDNINPNDIESIQVLKDAASTSQYGSRSAGGVVIITTKKGKNGRLSVNAGTQAGMQTLGNRVPLLNAQEWGDVYWEAARNAGQTRISHPLYGDGEVPVLNTAPYLIPNGKQVYQVENEGLGTDWYDAVYQNALSHQHFLNFSNGSDKGSFMAGFSYFDQDGLIRDTYFDRITGRFNSSFNLTPWLQVGENFSVAYTEQVQIGTQQGQDGIPNDVIRQHPGLPVLDLAGDYAGKIAGFPDVRNMVSVLEKNRNNTTDAWRVFGNAYAQADLFRIFPNISKAHSLTAKTNLGVEYANFYDIRFQAAFSEGDFDIQNNFLTNTFGRGLTLTGIHTLQYQLDQAKHRLQVIGGMETVQYDFTFLTASRNDFLLEDPAFTYLQAGAGDQTNSGGGDAWGRLSYFTRADYTFDDKYIASATLRYDRTSRFDSAGLFPAVSLGWWISEESFFQDALGKSTSLKLRASWGIQGNDRNNNFANISTLGPNPNNADYDITGANTTVIQGFRIEQRGNPLIKWESTTQLNLGFDLILLDGKMNVALDYYDKQTNDILLSPPLLATEGEGTPPQKNIGRMDNAGVDLSIGYRFSTNSDFNFEVNLQGTYINNEVIEFGTGVGQVGNEGELYLGDADGLTRITVGRPLGVFYGFQVDGIFQNQEEVDAYVDQPGKGVGRLRYKDLNGDSVINQLDRTYLGDGYADFSFGLNLVANWKRLSVSANIYGAVGQQIYNLTRIYTDFAVLSNFNRGERILDAWSPENTNTTIPAPTLSNANNELRNSDYFIENGDFVRLRSIRLSYDLTDLIFKDGRFTLYAEVQNVYTLTGYTGIDPEVPFTNDTRFPGIDSGVYPLPRTYLLGLNMNL